MKKHIILDTDIGGDPDDILTVLFALNSSGLALDLVVTNDEHKGDRARFGKKFFSIYGKKAQIVSGIDNGKTRLFVVEKLIKNFEAEVDYDYLDKIKKVVEKNELTYYVCIGPQSNLSNFMKKFPELKDKIEILIMGGAINYRHKDRAEHNIYYDIQSAIDVFNSDWNKRYVLSDVAFKEEIEINKGTEFYKKMVKLNKPHMNLILDSMDCFFEQLFPATRMHDPLTLSYLLNGKIINFDKKKISINEKGIMSLSENGKETIVATSANYDLFWELFENRILN